MSAMLSNTGYALIAPFLPIELERLDVSVNLFGYIFAMFPVAVCLFSPMVGYLLDKYKRRRLTVQVGLVGIGLSMLGFTLVTKIQNKTTMILYMLLLRFV
jgi:MFS family permease